MKKRILVFFALVVLVVAGLLVWWNTEPYEVEGVAFCPVIKEALQVHENGAILAKAKLQRQEQLAIESDIDRVIDSLSLEQKLAQMMILTNERDITQANLSRYQPGGVLFFGVDFRGKTCDAVKQRVERLQSYVTLPLFVGVDEEGGAVSRLTGLIGSDIPQFESARAVYGDGGEEGAYQDAVEKSCFLKTMGINVNFNPVADVVKNKDSYMYERSASGEALEVSRYVAAVVRAQQENNMISCMKHFPGYGENGNTHTQYACDSRTLSQYQESDFLPFISGWEEGADMLMVSHIIMECIDKEAPASLSPWVHRLIREELCYGGVVIADDLKMRAIQDEMSLAEATKQAFAAGNDMVFSADFAASMQGAREAVAEGKLTEDAMDASLHRILRLKRRYGLLE